MSTAEHLKELMQAISASGDKRAFMELFKVMAPKVKAFMLKAGMSADQAEDIAQEVMLKVWRNAHQYVPAQAAVSTWIFTIARNARIDLFRKENRPELDPNDPALKPEADKTAEEAMDLSQQSEKLREAIAALPDNQMEVLNLAYFAGLSHSEIAKRIKIPNGTVKSRIRLATERLRINLKEFE